MTLGERIAFVRKNNHLNQKTFAEMLGISQTHVSKIENSVENPSETLLLFISYKFAVNIDWLKDEQGSCSDNDTNYCSAEPCLNKLAHILRRIEEKASHMSTDSACEYVNCIINFEKILDCGNIEQMNDSNITLYYESIGKFLSHLAMFTASSKDAQRTMPETGETISKYIDRLIDACKET